MVTKESLKNEIDNVDELYFEALYKVIKAFEPINKTDYNTDKKQKWEKFIQNTYGSFEHEPIIRPDQGQYEIRELLE